MFGAEVEDVWFVYVVVCVGVEGYDAYSMGGWQVVDIDRFAGEPVVAIEERDRFAFRVEFGEFAEGGEPGAGTGCSAACR